MFTVIEFTQNDIEKATGFAKQFVPTIYDRPHELPVRQEHNYRVAKLGEIAFVKFLRANGKTHLVDENMFTVGREIHGSSAMDFQTSDGKSIGINTVSEIYHTRILVPYDQYRNQPKDYYVGVRLFPDKIMAEVIGFAKWEELEPFGGGDYPAYARGLDLLCPVSELLDMIPDVPQLLSNKQIETFSSLPRTHIKSRDVFVERSYTRDLPMKMSKKNEN